jgi:hypothetical protein
MKNSELLATNRRNLPPVEKQRRFVLRSLVQKNTCPNCGHALNFFEAADTNIDDWSGSVSDTPCRCSACKRDLRYDVPFLAVGGNGGWLWHLIPIEPKS